MPYLRELEKCRTRCRGDKSPTCHLRSPPDALRHPYRGLSLEPSVVSREPAHSRSGLSTQDSRELAMTGRCACSCVAVMSLLQAPTFAAETLWTEVTVRVYDNTGATEAERRPSLKVAASIVS